MGKGQSLSSSVYEKIKKDIIELKYAPGAVLNERELVDELGVSRTPIREAIIMLIQEEWLTASARKSVKVKELSIKSVNDIFQFRQMIEFFTIRQAFKHRKARHLAGQLDLVVQEMEALSGQTLSFIKTDLLFHTLIVQSTDNHLLSRMWKNTCDDLIRIALFSMDELRRPDIILSEHQQIVQTMWDGDLDTVLNTLSAHHNMIFDGFTRCFEYQEGNKEK